MNIGLFFLTLILALLLTPLFRRFAVKHHIIAQLNHRTVHEEEIPKLGGGGIIGAFLISWILYLLLNPTVFIENKLKLIAFTAGFIAMFIIGALDDKKDLNCTLKLILEIIVAIAAAAAGWRLQVIVFPMGIEWHLGLWGYPLTILWIVGLMNSYNMVDGLDGLAGGIGFVVSLMSLIIAAMLGNVLAPVIALILMGAIAGFLRYNINPASVFMGDSGSLSIGFILSCMTLNAAMLAPGRIVFIVPVLLLGLPILDTTLAVIRRLRRGQHPFHADKEHIHHRLVNLGLSHSGAALGMAGIALIVGIIAFLIAHGVLVDLKIQ